MRDRKDIVLDMATNGMPIDFALARLSGDAFLALWEDIHALESEGRVVLVKHGNKTFLHLA